MAEDRRVPTPSEQLARLYEEAEAQAAKASERMVGSQGFASLLGQVAENVAALTKLGNDAMDLVIRNLRVAGRRDIVRLARQLGRTEDKLERVLQELEDLRDQVREREQHHASLRPAGLQSPGSTNGAGDGSTRPAQPGLAVGSAEPLHGAPDEDATGEEDPGAS
jgi:hypothetical protein